LFKHKWARGNGRLYEGLSQMIFILSFARTREAVSGYYDCQRLTVTACTLVGRCQASLAGSTATG